MPNIKGLGPAIGGGILAEIGTIRRFPNSAALASYARLMPGSTGRMPKRVSGEVSSWAPHLDQTIWLWFSDQLVKQKGHIFNEMYYVRKLDELTLHPEVVEVPISVRNKPDSVRYDYTLAHLDRMAKRWVGNRMVQYVWGLWNSVDHGDVHMHDLTPTEAHKHAMEWYVQSEFPAMFAKVHERFVDIDDIKARINVLADPRRRTDPKVEDDDHTEADDF